MSRRPKRRSQAQRRPAAANEPPSRAASSTGSTGTRLPATSPGAAGASDHERHHHSPFVWGFFATLGGLLAFFLGQQILAVSGVLTLIVVAAFLAVGLNPAVEFLMRQRFPRGLAVLAVILAVVAVVTGFVVTLVPVITDQVTALTDNVPGWISQLQENERIQSVEERYQLLDKAQQWIESGSWTGQLFGGVVGVGLAVLGALTNTFVVIVLMLYFLASLPTMKAACYRLAPASRRARVSELGDRVLAGIGGYVSGAFVIALCAGISSLVFLFVVGMGEYAVALSFVVALLSLIPMVGATISMVIVSLIALSFSPTTAVVCLVFYLAYQQVENYVLYPRVMQRSVDIPGSVTVIAALFGASLLGILGALLAVPTAAAILMLTREIVIRRQDGR